MNQQRALFVLAVAYFTAFSSGGIQLPLTSTAMSNVGLSMTVVGWMWAARSITSVFSPALWGVLADRHGDARPFAIGSLVIGAALLLLLSQTTSPAPAILFFALYGLFTSPMGSLVDGMTLTALGDAKARFGRYRAFGTIGFGVTAFVSAILIDRSLLEPLPRVLFPICAGLTFSGAVVLLFLPRLPRPSLARVRDVLPVLKRPDIIALFVTSTILWCSHTGFASFVTPLATSRGLPEWSVGGSLAASIIVEAIMLREAGRIMQRFGARPLLVGICALAVVRWLLTAIVTDPVLFIVLNGMHGVTFGLFFGVLVAVVAARTPPEMRQAMQGTVASAAFGLGGALGSPLCGVVFEHTDAQTTWLAMAAISAVAFVVAWRTIR